MAKQTFTTGQVLTAAQMTSLQQTAMGGGSPSTKTASYVLTAADAGTVIQMNSASATTITVNTSLFAAGDSVQIQNIGAGTMTITAGTATVNSAGTLGVIQYDGGFLYFSSTSSAIWFDYTQAGTALPLTTKGDLFGYSTTNARIPVGANATVLTADSTEALGVKWATPAAGGGLTLLSTTTLSGTSTTISSINQTYKNLHFIMRQGGFSAAAKLRVKPNNNTSTTSNNIYTADQVDATTNWDSLGGNVGNNSGLAVHGVIYDYASSNSHPLIMFGVSPQDGQGTGFLSYGANDTNSAITSLVFTTQAGTSTLSGTLLLYGEN